ncbi:DUF397 domain-containing protein [uncultured Streptomyces sp.]|uniref:DUF397 domain-containing protein n=1 Tax=uncultured Streptomyces sp. TaxID=174707 RepID=UPI00260C034B|nr:DUF397 domain-containing protein [uncultured Streptomyces sp.]
MSTTEVAYYRSSYSGTGGGNCVEVATTPARILVRDSKDTRKPALAVSPSAWQAFTAQHGAPRA